MKTRPSSLRYAFTEAVVRELTKTTIRQPKLVVRIAARVDKGIGLLPAR